jgi:2-polyprenyl-3-methyl-5-hydroxy-6-metoxy-1,4-benzoquinol methylase
MTTKDHYDNHLASFYSWMAGDFETRQKEFQAFLGSNTIFPVSSKIAIDLGAGHGIQSASLAKLGFAVKAIDFNKQLLEELKTNCKGLEVEAIEGDIKEVKKYKDLKPELIVCWGDTLTHLETKNEIENFIENCIETLASGGKLLLSFRDYSEKLNGTARFIPVKSDANRILTCMLEYSPTHVTVNDLLYEFNGKSWEQKISSYNKVRISASEVIDLLNAKGMRIRFNEPVNRLVTIIAQK